ncbi:Uncharacterized conserved protein, DUF305 family [Roseomonas rosea]|uniref:Uncharacterized conserved protein, DUF305 family n=1 Tax=Muricoccus roseus TaxID=198092 RepID=A0A1M6IQ08_9PROT|nr:DUF305 domain-containing protein [Roseomonas rosea]SHJ36556.1 Uncharacterized conserved protein, DUF305 family [Roseomonas rosea]
MIFIPPATGTSVAKTRSRRPLLLLAVAASALLAARPALAVLGEGDGEGAAPVVTRSYTVVSPERLAAVRKADRDYVTGMRAHHAGALTMSQEYLKDPQASSPILKELAHAIMQNQRYEIAVLDEVARQLDQAPRMVDLGFLRFAVQPAASEGLAQQYRYARYPVPSLLTPVFRADAPVTMRDVQFAKAMTIHHQGALDMARAYQADPNARNSFLGLMNVDIVTDQSQEIALMRRVVAAYAGDAEAVPVPASMIHGMDGMSHGGHGGASPPADRHAGHGTGAAAEQGGGHAGREAVMPPAPARPRRAATPPAQRRPPASRGSGQGGGSGHGGSEGAAPRAGAGAPAGHHHH